MAEKDIISKQLLKQIAIDMAIYLFKLDIGEAELLETETQRVEQRRADLLLQVKAPEQYLLHIEVQNNHDPAMPLRMLRYWTDIALAYPCRPIRQYVIYIGKPPLRMADYVENDGWRYHYHLINMQTLDCRQFLQQPTPDALILAILCDFKGKPPREVVRTIVQRLQYLLQDDTHQLHNYLEMLEILSSNRDLQTLVYEEKAMLSTLKLSDLPSYQAILQQGMQQGVQQGMQQGMHEGQAIILRRQLIAKFGAIPASVEEKIIQADTQQLMSWAEALLTAQHLDEVFSE